MLRPIRLTSAALVAFSMPALAQNAPTAADLAPGQNCAFVTQANADASAGTANIAHDGSPLPGITPPDISQGFRGIPRSAQPPLTASQRRILQCTYVLPEAGAEMPYTLFIPSGYDPAQPTPVVVDLHGLNITPLMQILFDGTTDLAERHSFIVVAPMGFSLDGWWGSRPGSPVETARMKPGTDDRYTVGELSEIDAMRVLEMVRANYNVDDDRIYLMGHSMGGAGTYYLGAKYNDLWAGVAPIAGAGGIRDRETAERFRALPTLVMHGELDSIVPAAGSRRSVGWLQTVGAPHLYLEFTGMDHEFWIRRGAAHVEKVFLFFDTVSRASNVGFITDAMPPGAN
jgi:poly(3-hydroxybutyrate) depolymerase